MRVADAVRPVSLAVSLLAVVSSFPLTGVAQDAEHDWSKTYPVLAHPQLTVEAGDSGVEISSCGACTSIRIGIHASRKLSSYVIEEHQQGNSVFFKLKERNSPGIHFSFNVHNNTGARITVETPAKLSLDAKVADGSLMAHGLNGELKMNSADGSVTAEDVKGSLDFKTSDGSVMVRRASGEIDARSSDGSVDVEGQFNRLNLHTSDGSVTLALAEGSKLTAASRIASSDGHVKMRLPRTLDADLDVSASDGHIQCDLPLKMEGFNSKDSAEHHIAGHLNAGGMPLQVHTSDGSVNIAAL